MRRMRYFLLGATVIGVATLMFYLNLRHDRNLQEVLVREQQIQEQFQTDPRFKEVIMKSDSFKAVSTINGYVATQADLMALETMVSKIPPFSGTYKWVVSVQVRE